MRTKIALLSILLLLECNGSPKHTEHKTVIKKGVTVDTIDRGPTRISPKLKQLYHKKYERPKKDQSTPQTKANQAPS